MNTHENTFDRAGECGGCERDFTARAAAIGQGLNRAGLCPACAPKYGAHTIDVELAEFVAVRA